MKNIDKKLLQYRNFFNKKLGTSLLEAKTWKTTRYMDFDPKYDCVRNDDYCLNYRNNTFNLIREHERDFQFLYEATGVVQPYSQLEQDFRDFCNKNLSDEMKKLSEKDFGLSESRIPLVDDVSKQIKDDNAECEIYSLVTFRFPYHSDTDIKSLLEDFIGQAEHDNYGVSKFGREITIGRKQPIPNEDLDLFFITFEAKYNNFRFSLAKDLYHFTSLEALHWINKSGLVLMSSNPMFTYDKRVYLFNNIPIKDIFEFAIEKAEFTKQRDFALLRISSQKLMKWKDYKDGTVRFYVDTKVSSIEMSEAKAIYTYEGIPRNFIEDDLVVFKLNQWFRPVGKEDAELSQF